MPIKLGLLSNNTKQGAELIRSLNLDKYFSVIMISAEIGFQKPDPKAFRKFFEALGVEAQNSIYIDDAKKSLSRSVEIGFTPVLFESADQLRKNLQEFSIL